MSDTVVRLLQAMSLAEKIGQLNHPKATTEAVTGAGAATGDIESRIRRGEVGSLAAGFEIERLRALQTIAVEQSPHAIPLLFTLDVIHGHRTIFPLPLGLASAWDMDLVRRTARVAATEAASSGVGLAWAPMLDITRDARWGRAAESPGEDPVLASRYAAAMVEGFQGAGLTRPGTMMATAKHFAGYGFSEAGRDYNAADISPYRMHNVVLPPFKAAIDAGAGAVMVGFHDLSGLPATAHRELLGDLLRGLWGFDGLVVSDYTAIMELRNHGVAADDKQAALLAFSAGVDIDLISECYFRHLPALVAEGRVSEKLVDAACRRVLQAKARLGLFDDPYRGLDEVRRRSVTLTPANRQLAREAAAKSCVLLKNNGVLPLKRNGHTFALIGPLADSRANMQGTWAVAARPADSVTVLEGMRRAAGDSARILHAKGANIVDDPDIAARLNLFGPTFTLDAREPGEMAAEAVRVALQADVVIACLGEAKEHSGESSTRTALDLPGSQKKLLQALRQTAKPLVLVTMSGRPLALEWEDRTADAILHTWFAGSEAGNAIADLLFGDVNPSGKLAMSFPRGPGQCPVHYAEAPTGRPIDGIGLDVSGDEEVDANGRHVFRKFTTACRLEGAHTPLYPFGHGLGYAAFDYSEVMLDRAKLRGADDVLTASVTVRNAGAVSGEEIVQLYVSDPVASRSRPVRELKGFHRITLEPGQEQRVNFRITVAELSFFRAEHLAAPERIWEPGIFVIEIGPSSDVHSTARVEWLADD